MHGVPLSARSRVTDLAGVDTAGKIVVFHKDSNSYEILEPHNDGYRKLIKEGYVHRRSFKLTYIFTYFFVFKIGVYHRLVQKQLSPTLPPI